VKPEDYLLAELRDLRAENRRLRRRNRWLEESKDEWKRRAQGERWKSLRWPRQVYSQGVGGESRS